MCGIAGIVKRDPRETVDEARLKGMRDVLGNGGPDGEGLLLDGPVGLGHRRLAIIDVAGGHQPMANEDETIWIVYNGEIYNHAALRPGLEARGHRYRTRSDTETIVHAYEDDGERCVERLDACSPSRSGIGPGGGCSSRATGSASSRCTTRTRGTSSCSRRRSRRFWPPSRGARRSTPRSFPSSSPRASCPERRRSSATSKRCCPGGR